MPPAGPNAPAGASQPAWSSGPGQGAGAAPDGRGGVGGRRPWIIGGALAAVVAVVAVALVVGGDGDPNLPPGSPGGPEAVNSGAIMAAGYGTVINADSFLAELDQDWRRSIAAVPDVNVRADGRCYYLLDPATKQFTSVAACGPARRVDSPDGGVWDTLEVQARPEDPVGSASTTTPAAGASRWILLNSSALQSGTSAPTTVLYRPDGGTPPEDAASLTVSPPPVAPDAFVATVDNLSGVATTDAVTIDRAKATVTSPGAVLRLTQVASTATVPATAIPLTDAGSSSGSARTSRPAVPAPGHHLTVFTVETTAGWPGSDADLVLGKVDGPPETTVTLLAGTTRTDITSQALTATSSWSGQASAQTTTFVASVADGTELQLAVGAAGHEQLLTVDTATRVADALGDVYARAERSTAVNTSGPVFLQPKGAGDADQYDRPLQYTAKVTSATMTPYDAERGWAPDGQAWLEVAVDESMNGGIAGKNTRSVAGWSITADGKTYSPEVSRASSQDVVVVAYLVPAATTQVTGSFVTKLTVPVPGAPGSYDRIPKDYDTAPLTFTASLG